MKIFVKAEEGRMLGRLRDRVSKTSALNLNTSTPLFSIHVFLFSCGEKVHNMQIPFFQYLCFQSDTFSTNLLQAYFHTAIFNSLLFGKSK